MNIIVPPLLVQGAAKFTFSLPNALNNRRVRGRTNVNLETVILEGAYPIRFQHVELVVRS
jgi:hypothetical protein